ncbi:glycoside hydrolase family 16 protein [Cercospora zeae-maydis SCOH1-5]|uniref:Crh-like protein n=1 Tax=Cercospora zeae-maydis SCOH1-5 TaxID=717836 RepID=A0A6A6FBL9_9PEZI|nr:glycoside hydrolase family 16 protein [Cercospora zeae-maydis SCOH1-5]
MRPVRFSALASLAALAGAQTFTDCNPLEKACPDEVGLPSASYALDFTQGEQAAASWTPARGTTIEYGADGAVFTIAGPGQAPTIASDFNIFFGRFEVTMKAASGTGIVSSIVMESADLDEIDWELLGSDNGQVQSNFYGKGNTTTYDRVVYHPVSDPQNIWHTYGIDWTSERIEFSIDGTVVRTVPYASALTIDGRNYPQTPMQLKLGSWAGGASPDEGTVEWAGGKTDFAQGPFAMAVKSVNVMNYNPACQYSYMGTSGSWQSINVIKSGDSCNAEGAASSAPATQSAVGTATIVPQTTVTSAPIVSQSVAPIENTVPSLRTTVTGSSYSVNTASIAALNSALPSAANSTAVSSEPAESATTTESLPSTSSSAEQSTGGPSPNTISAGITLLSQVLLVALFV